MRIGLRIDFISVRTQLYYVTHTGIFSNKRWHITVTEVMSDAKARERFSTCPVETKMV